MRYNNIHDHEDHKNNIENKISDLEIKMLSGEKTSIYKLSNNKLLY